MLYKTNADGSASANNVYYAANEWGIDYYKGDGDPRVTNIAYLQLTGFMKPERWIDWCSLWDYLLIAQYAAANVAGIGPGLYKTSSSPQMLFSAAESLLPAEQKQEQRGFITWCYCTGI